jgi:hypothetical protein
VNIGGSCGYRVNDFALGIDANVPLYSKVPLISFLGLVHHRGSRLLFVLGRARGVDNTDVDNGAVGDLDPLGLKIFPDRLRQGLD